MAPLASSNASGVVAGRVRGAALAPTGGKLIATPVADMVASSALTEPTTQRRLCFVRSACRGERCHDRIDDSCFLIPCFTSVPFSLATTSTRPWVWLSVLPPTGVLRSPMNPGCLESPTALLRELVRMARPPRRYRSEHVAWPSEHQPRVTEK